VSLDSSRRLRGRQDDHTLQRRLPYIAWIVEVTTSTISMPSCSNIHPMHKHLSASDLAGLRTVSPWPSRKLDTHSIAHEPSGGSACPFSRRCTLRRRSHHKGTQHPTYSS